MTENKNKNKNKNERLIEIVIPAYNEDQRLAATIFDLAESFYHWKDRLRILCILNGCVDSTRQVVENCQAQLGSIVEYQDIKGKIGKGGAVLKGFELAEGTFISFVDADGSVRANELKKLFLNIADYDAIIGSRHLKDSKILVPQPLSRKIAGRLYNLFVRFYLRMPFKDTQCGAKIYRKHAAKRIASECSETGWGFDVAMLKVLLDNNYRVREYPVQWINDERSKVRLFIDGYKMLKSLFFLKNNISKKINDRRINV